MLGHQNDRARPRVGKVSILGRETPALCKGGSLCFLYIKYINIFPDDKDAL